MWVGGWGQEAQEASGVGTPQQLGRRGSCGAVEGKQERILCRLGSGWLSSSMPFFQSQPFDPWRLERSHLHLCFLLVVWGGGGEGREMERMLREATLGFLSCV